jgi:hypothetical protein
VEILAEDDADINATQGVGLDAELAFTEGSQDIVSLARITPPDQHLRELRQRIRVAQKYHVQALSPKQPSSRARRALPASSIQHFNDDPLCGADRRGSNPCRPGPKHDGGSDREHHRSKR